MNKRFLPNVSSISCETSNAHCARATVELLQKETPEFISPQLWPPTSPDLNPFDNSMLEILQEMVHKTRIWNALPYDEVDFSSLRRFRNSLTAKVLVRYCSLNFI